MKIALIHDFLTKIGGADKMLQIFHEIFPDAPIYTLLYDKSGTKHLFDSSDYTIIPSSLNRLPRKIRTTPKYLLGKYPRAVEEFDLSEYDVVISLSNSFAHGVITSPKTLHICYCWSPARYLWDWYHEYLAENHIGFDPKGMYIRKLLHEARVWDHLSAKRVDQWLTQSETVAKRIKKYFQADSTVINPPVDLTKIKPSDEDPEDYCLIVSRLEPYKKIDLAVEAFNQMKRPLVIIGEGSDRKRLESIANANITFLGWQSDEKVFDHMSKAYAFIFPGEEDFGLTPIESMAAGRPVVAFAKGGVTETVIAGKTGVFFNEQSPESLIAAVQELSENYFDFSPEACREQAEKYDKSQFMTKIKEYTIEAYHHHKLSMK